MNETATNPWVVQAPKQSSLPVGFYVADYEGVEDFSMTDGAVKWRWKWKVKAGTEAGKDATALTDKSISTTTLPGRLIEGLLGRAIQVGENVQASLETCKGKTYMVGVQPGTKGGKPCVRTVSKPPVM